MLGDEDIGSTKHRPSAWTNVTTNDFLVEHLLALYFCWEYPTFASFSKEHFLLDYNSGTGRFCSSLLVNAILAIGARLSDLVEARMDPDDRYSAGDQFFHEAQRLLSHEVTPTVITIQALNLMSLRQASSGNDGSGWHYARYAMRIALDLDLPDDDLNQEPPNPTGFSRAECQVRVATFWGCFALEHAWALLIGRVPQIKLKDIKVHKPIIVDEIEHEKWTAYTDEGCQSTESSLQEANLRLVFMAFSDLSELVHQSVMLLYSNELPLTSHEILVIYTKYLQWYANLPDQLRLGNNSTPVVLFVHSISPRFICTEASKNILALVQAYKSLYGLRRVPVFTPYLILNAELGVLVENAWWGVETEADTHTTDNFGYLGELSWACPFAQRAITIRNFFQDRWNGNVHRSDRATMDEEADIDGKERLQMAWDRRGTFFQPNGDLEPHHTRKPDPNLEQILSPTGLGFCLFSQQADPLKKILHKCTHDQYEQDSIEGMQEKLEAHGLEQLQS
ncbi:uncharacterized protein A1O9_10515 [Exophiala aquamarina CBS 119918]|uniref:Xylanolytic transcriptional activator regulatory domain-containing protein n=1 Tax=Exophiala aquamarina CBS 119918 TaxID=1182545 RepID=A0A072PD82_9EURO|nr:uncharacterized protein A1O9_10515 [Exophiala aquamarina CBS 119918]KEF53540.1 hypothetical protein A1O9_10515 [Exophiala aquamarina CBS 119918]